MFKIDDHRFVVNDLRPRTHNQQRNKIVTFTNHASYRYRLTPQKNHPDIKKQIEVLNKVHLSPLDRLKVIQKLKRNIT
tara:strand:+ start:10037 stop:10270 length:234 start_codon:yes stop_codon:yes gene_type:complete